jgi:hypothetical protein
VTDAAYTGVAFGRVTSFNTTTNTTDTRWRFYAGTGRGMLSFPKGLTRWPTADLKGGQVHVFDGNYNRIIGANGSDFSDPSLPENFAPYNVWVHEDTVYVTYALRDPFSGACQCPLWLCLQVVALVSFQY